MSGAVLRGLSPTLARIKVRGVCAAIEACGNIDGAAATVDKSRSVVGDWHNINHPAFPSIEHVFAMEQIAVATGREPPVLTTMAAELGYVCIRLPQAPQGEDAVTGALIHASAEFGDIATAVRASTRDATMGGKDRETIIREIDGAVAALARMRAIVAMDGAPAAPPPLKAVREGE